MTRTIAHLSDLHFGKVDPATLDPLVAAVRAARPDVLAVSGDLTQRARSSQFREAREFLDRLPGQLIVVPGNHDVPAIGNPYQRFVSEWSRFRRYIHPETEQEFADEAIVVIGVNTARALSFKGGRINATQMEMVRRCFHQAAKATLKVLVVHHPLDVPHAWPGVSAMRAKKALKHWEDCGVDLILAGHEHRAFAGKAERLRIGNHDAVVVQAGTATSTRVRGGEPNSFNLIHTSAREVRVHRMNFDPLQGAFVEHGVEKFARK